MTLGELYRAESGRVLATLVRLLGDVDLAEEAVQDAFAAAAEQWPADGVPDNPRAWLISAGRFKAIDRIRRGARLRELLPELARLTAEERPDDELRLILMCCHPALPPDAQVAMTLREVCGLTTEEIAAAFLTTAPVVAQRIVRAKAKIKKDRIPYDLPDDPADRLETAFSVVYLIFTQGYTEFRDDLAEEAIRLARRLPGAEGLLALLLFQHARRGARLSPEGDLVLLADQDRSRWDLDLIAEGAALLHRARVSTYSVQAAIAAAHTGDPVDWAKVVALHDLLPPDPVAALNRAVAVAMRDGPRAGLDLIEPLMDRLEGHALAHAARADLLRRLGLVEEAGAAYTRALELTNQEPQRRFLRRRLTETAGLR
ncbi:RNA polymerase sigma factor [Herbidospora mongoliensis]|uniref:RNA polymerase sigma factor n=1 Tax=Herbidospora mongoliensis TaxID=688067 RepID=UPI0008362DF1|nr:DUF6596 domain-containing protein [Herbidospora mongoliensis]